MEKKRKKKKDGGEGSSKSIRSPSRAPVRAGTRRVGWKTGEQEPRSLDKDLGQEKSGKGRVWKPVELKARGKGSRSPTSGLRATCQDRRSWLGGKSGATSSCTWNWLYQGLSSHLNPAPWPLVPGSACCGFGPGSCVQKLASDFQIVTLPARALVSTITHPTAWSLKPSSHSQSHSHCPVVSIALSLPPCHLCCPDCPSLLDTIPSSRNLPCPLQLEGTILRPWSELLLWPLRCPWVSVIWFVSHLNLSTRVASQQKTLSLQPLYHWHPIKVSVEWMRPLRRVLFSNWLLSLIAGDFC